MCFEATKWNYFSTFCASTSKGGSVRQSGVESNQERKRDYEPTYCYGWVFPVFNIRIWGFYTLRSMVDLFLVLI